MPCRIYCDSPRVVERCTGGGTVVTAESGRPVACDGSDHSGGMVDLADPIVGGVGNKDVAVVVYSDSPRSIKRRCGARPVVARKPLRPVARNASDNSRGKV